MRRFEVEVPTDGIARFVVTVGDNEGANDAVAAARAAFFSAKDKIRMPKFGKSKVRELK